MHICRRIYYYPIVYIHIKRIIHIHYKYYRLRSVLIFFKSDTITF